MDSPTLAEKLSTLRRLVSDARDYYARIKPACDWLGPVADLDVSRLSLAADPSIGGQGCGTVTDVALTLGHNLRCALASLEKLLKRQRDAEETRSSDAGITPEHLDSLVYFVGVTRQGGELFQSERADYWETWHDDVVKRLEGLRGHLAEPQVDGIVVDTAIDLAGQMYRFIPIAWVNRLDVEDLQNEVKALRQRLACRPRTTSVTVPAQTVKVHSDLQREILRLMAVEGLGRSWRIIESITAAGLGQANSVRNGFRKLTRKGLIDFYRRDGKPVFWKPVAGGNRRLWVLTELGQSFCQEAFGREPVESEVVAVARKHSSAEHGVGILEARDHLRSIGYIVDDDPAAILRDANEQWGCRVEADLLLTMESEVWPVEVQREVHERTLEKWRKVLALVGRLVIVLFNEEKREQQRRILSHCRDLPRDSQIHLTSLEALEAGNRAWTTISVRQNRFENP